MPTIQEDLATLKGQKLVGNDDAKLGTIDDIYLDAETGKPEWLAVKTGMFGSKVSFVPMADAQRHDDHVQVPYTKAEVKDAPNADADGALSEDEERRLYEHYGHDYSLSRSDSGLPGGDAGRRETRGDTVGRDTSGPTTDDAMTRSEEELEVGTTSREAGRARLRKYVVTEQVETTVPVQREEVRVEREPITDASRGEALDGPAISGEEHEVVLHAEEPVVEKQVVPKERVSMHTDAVTEEKQVSGQVRKERIDVDGDTPSR